jgi:hypothetical protein
MSHPAIPSPVPQGRQKVGVINLVYLTVHKDASLAILLQCPVCLANSWSPKLAALSPLLPAEVKVRTVDWEENGAEDGVLRDQKGREPPETEKEEVH